MAYIEGLRGAARQESRGNRERGIRVVVDKLEECSQKQNHESKEDLRGINLKCVCCRSIKTCFWNRCMWLDWE